MYPQFEFKMMAEKEFLNRAEIKKQTEEKGGETLSEAGTEERGDHAGEPSQVIHLLGGLKGTAALSGSCSSLHFCWTPNWRFWLEASRRLLTGVGLTDGCDSED